MILDKFNEFSDAQAVTATAISTNVVDLYPLGNSIGTNTTRDIGTGEDIYLVVTTEQAATDSGSDATLTVTLESDSTENLATSPTVHFSTGALAFAAFSPAGTVVANVKLPAGSYERYLGVRYTVASGPLTAGTFNAFLVKDAQAYRAYANGYQIV
jgi:hypothetical protein